MRSSSMKLASVFLCLLLAIYFFRAPLHQIGADETVLHISNILLLLVSMINLSIVEKGLKNGSPHAFVRSVMGGMTLKMLVLLVVIMIYANSAAGGINKYSVILSLAFYFIYLIVELSITMTLNKKHHA